MLVWPQAITLRTNPGASTATASLYLELLFLCTYLVIRQTTPNKFKYAYILYILSQWGLCRHTVPVLPLYTLASYLVFWWIGGLSLGALVTQDGEEEPLYYDADEIEDASRISRSWCRNCRSRSRSRSRGTGEFSS